MAPDARPEIVAFRDLANGGFLADSDIFGGGSARPLSPNSRHSLADVRYRAVFVCFTPESRRGSGRSRESEDDPTRTFERTEHQWPGSAINGHSSEPLPMAAYG